MELLTTFWRRCAALAVAFGAAVAFCVPAAAQQQPRVEEYELKAIFISNFLKYVEWPETAFADAESPIVVGIQGDDPFGPVLDELITQLQPIVGRQADLWNGAYRGDDDWKRKRGIIDDAAVAAGRDPADIENTMTVAGDLPESDADSEAWVERLGHLVDLGVSHFVMDFGHPLVVEPALRFAEQVIPPLRDR